jgi:hypothetical protein
MTRREAATLYTLTTREAYPDPSGSQHAPLFWAEPRQLNVPCDIRVILPDGRRATLRVECGSTRRTLVPDTAADRGYFGISGFPVPARRSLEWRDARECDWGCNQ